MRSIGHRQPSSIGLGCGLSSLSLPRSFLVSSILPLCLSSASCFWAGLSSFPLRVPRQCLSFDAGAWFSERMTNPAPLPPQDLFGDWLLSSSFPQVFITDFDWPSNVENAPQTVVNEGLDLPLCQFRLPPRLKAV